MSKGWAAQHLAEFLAVVSSYPDEQSAIQGALEWTTEALEAEVAAIVADGAVRASLGFGSGPIPVGQLVAAAAARGGTVTVPPGVDCPALVVALDRGLDGASLVLARVSEDAFSSEEMFLVRTLARILTLTLGIINHLSEARERQALLERLARIQRSISHRVNLEEVLDAIVVGARELLAGDGAALWMLDPGDPSTLVVNAAAGSLSGARRGDRCPLARGVTGQAVRSGELAVQENRDGAGAAVQPSMSAPVFQLGGVAGALTVSSFDPARSYSTAEREVLLAFAEHVQLAITNARTRAAEAQQERQGLEFNLARKILADLSPSPPVGHPWLDVAAESRPASIVGGDFFDFDAGDDGGLVSVLGDVAGKGIPAALLVAMTRASIRAALRSTGRRSACGVLRRANGDLCQDFGNLALFATVLVARFEPRTQRLLTANAGHSPVIYRPAGGQARLVRCEAPPIGILPDWRSHSHALRMGQGDLLVVATDGFCDAVDARTGELYGNERLLELADRTAGFGAADIARAFFEATDTFSAGGPPADDRTLLVLRGRARS